MDIYSIGIKADTRDIDRGKKRLDDFAKSAEVIDIKTGKARDSMGRFVKGTDQAGGAIAKANKSLVSFNNAFSLFSGILGGLSIGKVVHDLAEFNSEMSQLRAVTSASGAQMDIFKDQARVLGATTIKTAQEVAQAQTEFARAGFSFAEILSATPAILQMSTAASIGIADAAGIASGVLRGFGLEVSKLNSVMDVLVTTANSSFNTVTLLSEAMSYVAPASRAANVSLEETAKYLGVLGDGFLQGSRGGTGLLGIMRQLSNVTPEAEKVLNRLGVTVKDVDITSNGLTPVIELLASKNISLSDSFKIFGTEAGVAANIILKTTERAQQLGEKINVSAGSTKKASDIISSDLKSTLLSLNSALSESVLKIGESQSYLNGMIVSITGVVSAMNGMLPQFAQANNLTATQAENYELIADTLQIVIGGLVGMGVALGGARLAMIAFNGVAAMNPFGLIAMAVGSLIVALIKLTQVTKTIDEVWEDAAKSSEHYLAAQSKIADFEQHIKGLHEEKETRLKLLAQAEKDLQKATEEGATGAIKYYKNQVDIHKGYADKAIADIQRLENARKTATKNYEDGQKVEREAARLASEEAAKFQANAILGLDKLSKEQNKHLKERLKIEEDIKSKLDALYSEANPLAAQLAEIDKQIEVLNKAEALGLDPEKIAVARGHLEETRKELVRIHETPVWWDSLDRIAEISEKWMSVTHEINRENRSSLDNMKSDHESLLDSLSQDYKKGLIDHEVYVNTKAALEGKYAKDIEKYSQSMVSVYGEAAKRIDEVFANMWMNLDDGFNSVAEGMRQSFQRMLAEMAHAATTQKLMVSMGVTQAGQAGASSGNPYAAVGAVAILGVTAAINNHNSANEKRAQRITEELVSNKNLTGTVLGDINAKSDSIKNSSESLADIASDSLSVNRGMYQALLNIQAGIVQVVSGIAKSVNVQGLSSHSSSTGGPSYNNTMKAAIIAGTGGTGAIVVAGIEVVDILTGGFVSGIIQGVSNSLFGKKESITAAGISIGETSIQSMEDGIETAMQAWRVKRVDKKSWGMSSTKFYDEFFELGDEVASQMSNIFMNMADAFRISGKYLSEGASEIDAFVGSLTTIAQKINLKDMSVDEQVEAIQNYISKVGDVWSKSMIDFLNIDGWVGQFRQSGEGMMETMLRISTQAIHMEHVFDTLGNKIATTNKGMVEITQSLVGFAGSFDNLIQMTSEYYDNFYSSQEKLDKQTEMLTNKFNELGYSMPATSTAFRNLVESLDLTSQSGQQAYVRLLELQGVVHDTFKQIDKLENERLEKSKQVEAEKISLEMKIAELTGDTNKQMELLNTTREHELLKMDESLRPLQERIWMLESESEATSRKNAIEDEKIRLEKQLFNMTATLSEQRKRELSLLDESNIHLQEKIWLIQDEVDKIAIANDLNNKKLSLENQILRMEGNVIEIRKRELQALDASLRPLQEYIYALEDKAIAEKEYYEQDRAYSEASNKKNEEKIRLQDQLFKMTATEMEIKNKELYLLDPSNRALQERIWMLEKEQQTLERISVISNTYSDIGFDFDFFIKDMTDSFRKSLTTNLKSNVFYNVFDEAISSATKGLSELEKTKPEIDKEKQNIDKTQNEIDDIIAKYNIKTSSLDSSISEAYDKYNKLLIEKGYKSVDDINKEAMIIRNKFGNFAAQNFLSKFDNIFKTMREIENLKIDKNKIDENFKEDLKKYEDELLKKENKFTKLLTGAGFSSYDKMLEYKEEMLETIKLFGLSDVISETGVIDEKLKNFISEWKNIEKTVKEFEIKFIGDFQKSFSDALGIDLSEFDSSFASIADRYKKMAFTEEELLQIRIKNAQTQLGAFKDLDKFDSNMSISEFRKAFEDVQNTLSGEDLGRWWAASQYLMDYNEALSALNGEVINATNLVNKEIELNLRIAELTNDEGMRIQWLAKQRAEELKGLDEISKSLQERIWLIEDEKKAQEDFSKAVTIAMEDLKKATDAEKNRLNEYYESIFEGLKSGIDSAKNGLSELRSTSDILHNAVTKMKNNTVGYERSFKIAQTAISNAALTGIVSSDISDYLDIVTGDSKKMFATFEEYSIEQAKTTKDILKLASITDEQITIDEKILSNLEEQLKNSELEKENAILNLDKQIEMAEKQYNISLGIDDSIKSVEEAIKNLSMLFENNLETSGYSSGDLRIVSEKSKEMEFVEMSKNNTGHIELENKKNAEIRNELNEISQQIKSGFYAVAKNTLDTSKQLLRWDGDGMPQERNF